MSTTFAHILLMVSLLQTELTSEEKRQSHQKELAEKLNADAKARLAGQKSKTDEKKLVDNRFTSLFFKRC